MRVVVLKERADREQRVALIPESAAKLAKAGAEVVIEQSAGTAAGFPDSHYAAAGAAVAPSSAEALAGADVVLGVQPPVAVLDEVPPAAVVISLVPAATAGDVVAQTGRTGRDRAGAGKSAAHHARAVDGHPVVPGDGRRLQGGAARCERTCRA